MPILRAAAIIAIAATVYFIHTASAPKHMKNTTNKKRTRKKKERKMETQNHRKSSENKIDKIKLNIIIVMNVRRAFERGKDAWHKYALRHSPVLFAFLADASHSATAAVYSIIFCAGVNAPHRHRWCLPHRYRRRIDSFACLFSCNNWIYYIAFIYLALSSDCVNIMWLLGEKNV